MPEFDSRFLFSFSDVVKNKIEGCNIRVPVLPLVLANKSSIQECLQSQFSLKAIYHAWMSHFDKPLFHYHSFRKACIKAGLYTPKNNKDFESLKNEFSEKAEFSTPAPDKTPSREPDTTPHQLDLEADPPTVSLSALVPDRPRRRLAVVHQPTPVEDLPDNRVPPKTS